MKKVGKPVKTLPKTVQRTTDGMTPMKPMPKGTSAPKTAKGAAKKSSGMRALMAGGKF